MKKMKKQDKKWLLFIIATLVTSFGIANSVFKGTSATLDVGDVETQIQALLETAHAYYRQGVQHQYDSYKKNLYSTPEDATSQHYTYTVCSGFTFQVYYQTLGIEIPDTTEELLDYAETNKDNTSTVIAYYGTSNEVYSEEVLGTASVANYSNLVDQWVDILQPGDVIVVTGHAMMVDSIDYENRKINLIESGGGGRYNFTDHYDVYDENGTVQYRDLVTKFKGYYNRITNDTADDELERIAVIRFITDGESYINTDLEETTYEITSSALSRLKYPSIDIEKIVKITEEDNVVSQNILTNIGEYITYELTITNNGSEDYENLDVIENIDSKVAVTDEGSGDLVDNQLKWTVSSLPVGESVTFSYTVRVPIDKSLFGEIIVSTGYVDNIATSKIETLIGNKLNSSEKDKIYAAYDDLKSNNQVEREFINQIYLDAIDLDLGLTGLSNFDIISYDTSITYNNSESLVVKSTRVNDTAVKKYIYNNFYGLRIGETNVSGTSIVRAILQWNIYPPYELNDRARTLTSDMLTDGDIVLVYTGETATTDENLVDKSYIYLNDKLVRKTAADEFEELSGDELTIFLRNIIGDNYIILRPSLAYGNMYDLEVGITSDKYVIEEDYIYVGNDIDSDVIENNIDVPDGMTLNVDLDNNKLQIKYGTDILDEFIIVGYSSDTYNLTNDYVYVGTGTVDLSKIDALGGKAEVNNNKLQIKYSSDVLKEFDVVIISFGELFVSNKLINLSNNITYDNFEDNVVVINGSYKILYNSVEITSGNIIDGSELKVYYKEEEVDSYKISAYDVSFDDGVSIDEDKKYIKYLNIGTSVDSLLDMVNITNGNAVVYDDENYKTVKSGDDVVASGDVLVIYSGDTIMAEYTLSVIGDANGDGIIDLIDLVQIRKHIVGWVNPETKVVQSKTGVYYYAIDMNKDGIIDLIDLVRMRKTIVGLI